MNPTIAFAGVAAGAAPADAIVAADPLWTPIVLIALGVELAWLAGALAFLWWLARPQGPSRLDPRTPKKRPSQNEPPLAA